MTSAFWVDPTLVKRTAPEFEDVASAVTRIHKALTDSLENEGSCWGDDHYGDAFLKKYKEPHRQAGDYFGTVAKSIKQIGTGLEEMAKTYDRGDEASNTKFT
ncbi:MAG: hypothetical protein WCA46_01870 [Actinocatenispora sp.]